MKARIGGIVAGVFLAAAMTLGFIPAAAHAATGEPVKNTAATEQLETWSRALKERNPSSAYASLSTLASAKKPGTLNQRAALALGYYDFSKGNYAKARAWLDKAEGDPLLEDYILYWRAETDRALKHDPQAIASLKRLRHEFPDSVMTEQALASLGESALAASQPQEILDSLAAYPETDAKPDLLFIRAQAYEAAGQFQNAARDYLAVAYKFPTSSPAHEAAAKADLLRGKLGADFPVVPLDTRIARAEALYASREWYQTREAYIELLPQLAQGADRDRANLRIAQCRVALGAPLSALTDLTIADPEADAERLYSISQSRRVAFTEAPILAAVDTVTARAPKSRWAELALFAAGNYYWVQLDRDRAASFYARVADKFPAARMPAPPTGAWSGPPISSAKPKPKFCSSSNSNAFRIPLTSPTIFIGSAAKPKNPATRRSARVFRQAARSVSANLFWRLGHCAIAGARKWNGNACRGIEPHPSTTAGDGRKRHDSCRC